MLKIGITGHQRFDGVTDNTWYKAELKKRIIELHSIMLAYSSLAIGADSIFAEIILSEKINLVAIIPSNHYQTAFKKTDCEKYYRLLNECSQQIILNYPNPGETAFLAAGKYITDNSDILFALWDGNEAQGLGGTGDIIRYAIKNGVRIIHINPWTKETRSFNEK